MLAHGSARFLARGPRVTSSYVRQRGRRLPTLDKATKLLACTPACLGVQRRSMCASIRCFCAWIWVHAKQRMQWQAAMPTRRNLLVELGRSHAATAPRAHMHALHVPS